MKITLNGVTYETARVPASLSRLAMELNVTALDAAEKAEALKKDPDAKNASALVTLLMTNLDEKVQLIVDVFGGEFPKEQLLDELTTAEINALLNAIASGK